MSEPRCSQSVNPDWLFSPKKPTPRSLSCFAPFGRGR